jgi:hypothetical protein
MPLKEEEIIQISEIKKLLYSSDIESNKAAVDLAISLNNPRVFDELLRSLLHGWDEIKHYDFKNYNPYLLLKLTNFAVQGSYGQKLRDRTSKLDISSKYSDKISLDCLSNFSNLTSLSIEYFGEITRLEEIYHLPLESLKIKNIKGVFTNPKDKWGFKNLKNLEIYIPNDLENKAEIIHHVDFISELVSLKSLNITVPISNNGSKPVEFSILGLEKLVNLEFLNITADVKSMLPLRSAQKLKVLNIKSSIIENLQGIPNSTELKVFKCESPELKDISAISNSSEIEFILLENCTKLDKINSLKNQTKLQFIDLKNTSIKTLDGIENAENLLGIKVSNSSLEHFDSLTNLVKLRIIRAENCISLKSLKGLKNNLDLKEINVENCLNLESLEGLEKCNLKIINFNRTGIKNLDALINSHELYEHDKWVDEEFRLMVHRIENQYNFKPFKYFKYINFTNEIEKDSLNLQPTIIEDCPKLESVEGLVNSCIYHLKISNCPKIKNIDYLEEFENLECCDFSDCAELESVESLAFLPYLKSLYLKNCKKVKPKPRFSLMDSLDKLNSYLFKLRKDIPKIELSKEKKELCDKLQSFLLSNDYSQINLGLELANSLDDIEIYKFLLDGVKFEDNEIIANSIFIGFKKDRDFTDYALDGLLCIAPEEIEVALQYRNSITAKSISGKHQTNLQTISELVNLQSLTIRDTQISILNYTDKLQNIEKIELYNNPNLNDLSGLKKIKKLKSITVYNCSLIDLKNFSDLLHLTDVSITYCPELISTEGMSNLPELITIKLDSNEKLDNIDSLGNMLKLKDISLNKCSGIKNISALAKLPELEVLYIKGHDLKNMDNISELVKPILNGITYR